MILNDLFDDVFFKLFIVGNHHIIIHDQTYISSCVFVDCSQFTVTAGEVIFWL